MPQADYIVTIDTDGVTKRLRDVNGRFVAMGKTGDDAMKKIGKSGLDLSHVMKGAVGGAFTALTGAALEFGRVVVGAFAQAIKSSTQAAIEFDVTRRKFISLFEGQEGQAEAVMDRIGQRAASLGIELNEALSLSRAFIPDVKGTGDPLGALDDLLVGVRALAEEDPVQGIMGARFAIDEAMSGSLRSLKTRFEFTKAEIDILKDAQAELGDVVGTIQGINRVMERRGVDVEALKGTFTQALGEMQFAVSKLSIELGKPIADKLTESMGELGVVVNEKSDDLQLLAGSIGDVVANVIDFISTNVIEFLDDFDVAGFREAIEAFGKLVNQALVLADILLNLEIGEGVFEDISRLFDKLGEALETLNKIVAFVQAVTGSLDSIGGDFETLKLGDFELLVPKSFAESILDSASAMEKGNQRLQENADALDLRTKKLNTDTDAALAEAEAFLKQTDATDEAAAALAKLGVTEKEWSAIQQEAARALEKRGELEKRFSQERADNARRSLQAVSDIEDDFVRSVLKAGIDLGRNGREMALKHGAERAEAEKGLRQELIRIEHSYQQELDRIARDTTRGLESAELKQDALAFVETLRQQEIAQEEAGVTRRESEEEAKLGLDERLVDLEESQAMERATLQRSYQDKLEDLEISLIEEFDQQQLADDRKLEQQALSEERRITAANEGMVKRLDKLTEGLDEEVAAVIRAEAAKLVAVEEFAAQAQAALTTLAAQAEAAAMRAGRGVGPRPPGPGRASRVAAGSEGLHLPLAGRGLGGRVTAGMRYRVGELGIEGYLPRRQFGGDAPKGGPMLVGELGEELFIPPTSGSIVPNNQIGAFLGGVGTTNNSSTEINYAPQFQLSNPALLSPQQAAQTRSIATSVATQMFEQIFGGSK